MLKHAKVINEETKQCEVGLGDPTAIFNEVEKTRTWQETEQQEQVVPAEYDEEGNLVKEETTEIVDVPVEKSETYIETTTVGEWYESIGMTEQDVEQAYNGSWYLAGYAPEKPVEEMQAEVRAVRNNYLEKYVDPKQLVLVWDGLTEEERQIYADYRTYLLDYTGLDDWYMQNPKTFDEWKESNNSDSVLSEAPENKGQSEEVF